MVDADQLLREVFKTIAAEQKLEKYEVKLKSSSSGNGNYTTKLYRASLSSPNRADLHLFGKVAVFSEELRKKALSNYFITECLFYTEIAKVYDRIQDQNNLTGDEKLVFPKLYGCNPKYMEETVVLEDLSVHGFTSYDRFKSMDWEYAASSVEEMAKFHALSIAYGQENPEAYGKLLEKLAFVIPAERESFRTLCAGWFAGALSVTKEEYKERFKRFMEKYGDMEETPQFYSPLSCPAITHGDFKITNLLHKRRDNEKLQVAILDFQTLRAGSPVSDLVYFVFTSSDRAFRRQHYRRLLDHYYERLSAALASLRVDPDSVYSREQFDDEMKTVLPFGLTVAVYVLLVLMVRDEDAPQVEGEMDFSQFAMKPNELYGERLNEIIEDYIEWGVL